MSRNAKTSNAKRNAKTNETPSIVLKTIYDDIMRDNKNSTLTTKKMRAKLRQTMNDVHIRNASWIFTQSQYDTVRSMFDAKYAATVSRRAKRETSSRQRAKAQTQTNAETQPAE